ncbi:2-heptaprenyl-1,4-naphthoquinone methyltransferase [Purpureocillium lilacinum]|uniref:2-heptaprenyl-1,4-naphthoquinone methyltransferase n=2 Tax=Purpureocillium lilacinum TaxID=33203 RepID=A0A179GKS5_PURLI|nr:2-heptaprenyl-1,4-naphthoquinone methyltransferase [Purpureocillium lilacinum]OAQ78485.1 2-heptaprenyl-1,4-naphthoquinone methyltransferase [Purpureocillium lilacinum]OAQ93780.1 2-heptaprenyl-1,4-naphthoquinone methyltransferase [Purpureocillium lilacinum]
MTDTTAVNQAYFNQLAAEYDSRFEKTVGRLEKEVRGLVDFIGAPEGGRLLDYACGTGLLSRALGDRMSQCVGVDVSESMVELYNAKAKSQGFTPEQRAAHVGNLLDPSDASPTALSDAQFSNFDVAGVGAGFHHFDDAHLAAARLAQRLRPDGGVLFILDFVAHEADPDHGATKGVRHHGFTEAQMRDVFERAGVGRGFEFRVMDEDVVFENARGVGKHMTRRVFFARGERA